MQQRSQRQILEETLANLEFKQRVLQRKIVRTQVQLELLNQREINRTIPYINYNQQTTTVNRPTNTNSSRSTENSINTDSDKEDEDSDEDSDDREPFRLTDGSPICAGDTVRLLNPKNDDEQEGVIIGHTPQRLKIKLTNGQIVLRQAENLERSP